MALQHMHTNNILHLSLRPSKILFDSSGYLKIKGFKTATLMLKFLKFNNSENFIVIKSPKKQMA